MQVNGFNSPKPTEFTFRPLRALVKQRTVKEAIIKSLPKVKIGTPRESLVTHKIELVAAMPSRKSARA